MEIKVEGQKEKQKITLMAVLLAGSCFLAYYLRGPTPATLQHPSHTAISLDISPYIPVDHWGTTFFPLLQYPIIPKSFQTGNGTKNA